MSAVFFRLGLGDDDEAVADARLYERNYGRSDPADTARVVFALGSIPERTDDWPRILEHYRDFLRRFSRSATPEQIARAQVQVGRATLATGDTRGAREAFDAALAHASTETADSASEALFELAELERAQFDSIAFPRYRGGRSLDRVRAWAQNDFRAWIERKVAALAVAARAYERIGELDVPRWEIAAAARIGVMWRSFVDDFRSAPVPDEIANVPAARDVYEGQLDTESQPFVREAVAKLELCIERSTRLRWFNEWSQLCEAELNRLDPTGYPLAEELRGKPSYSP